MCVCMCVCVCLDRFHIYIWCYLKSLLTEMFLCLYMKISSDKTWRKECGEFHFVMTISPQEKKQSSQCTNAVSDGDYKKLYNFKT